MLGKRILKSKNLILSMLMAVVMFFVLFGDNNVYAASATVTISTASATQGEEVSVTVTINADANIGAYNFYLQYDANILEAVSGYDGGGGGSIQLTYDVPSTDSVSKSLTRTIKFKAKAPGTSAIKYVCINADDGILDFDTVENMATTSTDGSVTVKAPVIASSNNNLSSLTVAAVRGDGSSYNVNLTPGFSKDVTAYNLQVEEGVTDLAITAKAEDAKAGVQVQWANLDPGDNTTKIIVTAEDGSTKQYNIYTKVPVPETSTPAPEEPITVDIGGVQHYIEDVGDAVALPEGFETVEYDYNGRTVLAGKGLNKDLIVMYITNGDGSAGSLYIYNEEKNSFYQMVNIEITQKLYTIVDAPEDLVIPAGFDEYTINIDGISFQGWKNDDIESVYLVYAMNWNGQSGLYFYDEVEKQMLKYFDTSIEAGVSLDSHNQVLEENEKLKEEVEKLQNTHNGDKNSNNEDNNLYKYIAIGCGVVVIILICVIIVLLTKKRNDEESDEENLEEVISEEEPQEDENVADSEEVQEDISEEVSEEIPQETIAEEEAKTSREVTEIFKDVLFGNTLKEEISEEIVPEEAVIEETAEEEAVVEETAIEEAVEEETAAEEVATEEPAEEEPIIEMSVIEELMAEEAVERETLATETEEQEEKAELNENIPAEQTISEEDIKKKKVAEILNDEESSINKEDMDLVIDELFDELFGE